MAYIGLGKINKNIIPLILGCVFCLLNRLVNSYQGTKLFKNVILTNIFIAISHSFIIIPYIIYRIITKNVEEEIKIKNNLNLVIHSREEKLMKLKNRNIFIMEKMLLKKQKENFFLLF